MFKTYTCLATSESGTAELLPNTRLSYITVYMADSKTCYTILYIVRILEECTKKTPTEQQKASVTCLTPSDCPPLPTCGHYQPI